jgi:hypothetical protein
LARGLTEAANRGDEELGRRQWRWGTGLGFAGIATGRARIRRRAREGVKGGTARDDERHVARKPRMDAGGRRVRAARWKQREGERRRLTGGPGGDFHFLFPFFFLGCDKTQLLCFCFFFFSRLF